MKVHHHKIPLRLKLIRFKNSRYLSFIDKIIRSIKPPKRLPQFPEKILFMRNDRIGDAVVTLPVLRDLKLNYPEIQIDVLASDRNSFIFNNISYLNEVIIFSPKNWQQENLFSIFKLPVIGRILQFIFYFIIPYYFSKEFRTNIDFLKEKKYNAVVDLVGSRRLAILGNMISPYTVGSRLFGLSWLYSYYMKTNWVSHNDEDFMSHKIEKVLSEAFEFKFIKRNTSLPLNERIQTYNDEKYLDLFIHLGTSELRKLNFEAEQQLIDHFKNKNILITDIYATERFTFYKKKYKNYNNIQFKLYPHLEDLKDDIFKSKILLCYDGGQAHFLGQFLKTITIIGPVSVPLWKIFEFKDYELIRTLTGGAKVIQSKGEFKHIAVYYPIWCNPCFDIGCETRPCLANINVDELNDVIAENFIE